jgi:hypothetical protein
LTVRVWQWVGRWQRVGSESVAVGWQVAEGWQWQWVGRWQCGSGAVGWQAVVSSGGWQEVVISGRWQAAGSSSRR